MNCFYCGAELICSSNIDVDEVLEDYTTLTYLERPKCESSVEAYKKKCQK